jgi:hypothetical protein
VTNDAVRTDAAIAAATPARRRPIRLTVTEPQALPYHPDTSSARAQLEIKTPNQGQNDLPRWVLMLYDQGRIG